jgi:hypothetical protein
LWYWSWKKLSTGGVRWKALLEECAVREEAVPELADEGGKDEARWVARREAEEDLADDIIHERGWRRWHHLARSLLDQIGEVEDGGRVGDSSLTLPLALCSAAKGEILPRGALVSAGVWVQDCWEAGGCHHPKSNGSRFCIHLIVWQLEIF